MNDRPVYADYDSLPETIREVFIHGDDQYPRVFVEAALECLDKAGHLGPADEPGRRFAAGCYVLALTALYMDFLHIAEEHDSLMIELTDFVFRTAMEQTRIWLEKGLYMELSLNLATHFLADLEFPDRLLAVIADHGLDPSMITLELKETAAAQNPEVMLDILARLRVKSVNLCLDDFGTGSSSLTHLYRMPFSEVKLDNAFVQDTRSRGDARAFVEGLVYLAHKLKLRVCAEGVEDRSTLQLLESMRCDKVQGHHIGAAMRARELERTVEAWNAAAVA